MQITHPGTCIAHPGRCIVLWGGCVSEFTLQLQGGIDSVKINTPPPWKKEWWVLVRCFLGSHIGFEEFSREKLRLDLFVPLSILCSLRGENCEFCNNKPP